MPNKLNIKVFIYGLAILIVLLHLVVPAHSQVYVGGPITTNKTYYPELNPYIVTQSLIVNEGVTLTILPGVQLLFEFGTGIINNGTLIARGTAEKKIVFRPKIQNELQGSWDGIVFSKSITIYNADSTYASGSVIANAVLNGASRSITLADSSSLLIENTSFSLCSFGIYLYSSGNNVIRKSTFNECDFGIFLASGFNNSGNIIYQNQISNCADVGIFINSLASESHHNTISHNRISMCGIGMHIGNYGNNGISENVITGNQFVYNKKDALKLFQHSNTVCNNYFVLNNNGIKLWQSDNNIIKQNLFSRNSQYAITLTAGSSNNNISNNSMNYSKGGIWIKPDSSRNSLYNSLLYNTLYDNTVFSVQIENSPQGPAQFNNVGFNGNFRSFINQAEDVIYGGYNYWATTSLPRIDSIIYDFYDHPQFGEVKYSPVLDKILSIAPVPPPRKVIKQIVGSTVEVSWDSTAVDDLKGYTICFGHYDGIAYIHKVDNGLKTSVNLGNLVLPEDTVAVTAYDFQSDGSFDQPEGYESDYAFALAVPYAGPDTAICFNSDYVINHATSYNYQKLKWTTSGDGTFSNAQAINTVYKPGVQDYSAGSVKLYLYGERAGTTYTDVAFITFHDAPSVFAGADTTIIADSAVLLVNATASGYDHLKWTSSGDGVFNSDTISNPVYTPGVSDKLAGLVSLTCKGFSACGLATDQIKITLLPGNTLQGRVHAGTELAFNSGITLFQVKNSKILPLRAEFKASDGTFKIEALLPGTVYLYAIPDKLTNPGYVPTYFFNDIHWANAHPVILEGNTYDVDIELGKSTVQLPAGVGSINGYCVSAPGSLYDCGDVTLFLYDKQMKNVLNWTLVRNGSNFSFANLPFGEYKLAGEKAGIPQFYSDLIAVTPSHPAVDNVKLVCAASGYKFTVPANAIPNNSSAVNIYPNPVSGMLYFSGLATDGNYTVRISNTQGVILRSSLIQDDNFGYSLDVSSLTPGLYIIEFFLDEESITHRKFVKN